MTYLLSSSAHSAILHIILLRVTLEKEDPNSICLARDAIRGSTGDRASEGRSVPVRRIDASGHLAESAHVAVAGPCKL